MNDVSLLAIAFIIYARRESRLRALCYSYMLLLREF